MPVRILVPTPLRPFTGRQPVVAAEGATVGELLRALTAAHPDLRPHLFSAEGALRSFVNVYVNDDDIRHLEREDTPVGPNDTVSIVPSVAGGSDAAVALSNDEIQRYSRHLIIPEVGVDSAPETRACRVHRRRRPGVAGVLCSPRQASARWGSWISTSSISAISGRSVRSGDVGGESRRGGRRLTALNPEVRVVARHAALVRERYSSKTTTWSWTGPTTFRRYSSTTRACCSAAERLQPFPLRRAGVGVRDQRRSLLSRYTTAAARLVPSCAEGVLGVLPGSSAIQATEAIKLIWDRDPLAGRLLLSTLSMEFRTMKLRRDPACPVCGATDARSSISAVSGIPAAAAAAGPPAVPSCARRAGGGHRPPGLWILDVREPREFEICRVPGSVLIPLGELPKRLSEIPQGAGAPDIVVHCKMGGRSAKAVALLRDHGITNARNLTGGILAWIDRVDPTLPKY
jgi:adenylyltransferase/sulfurtransferase